MFNRNKISPLPLEQLMGDMFQELSKGLNDIEGLFQNKKTYTNYPPSNIFEKTKEINVDDNEENNKLLVDVYFEIQLSVAGWKEEDFQIQIENDDTLKIIGKKEKKIKSEENIRVIHSSIAERDFVKEYGFSKPIEKVIPKLEEGILSIEVNLKSDEPKSNIKKIGFSK